MGGEGDEADEKSFVAALKRGQEKRKREREKESERESERPCPAIEDFETSKGVKSKRGKGKSKDGKGTSKADGKGKSKDGKGKSKDGKGKSKQDGKGESKDGNDTRCQRHDTWWCGCTRCSYSPTTRRLVADS
jgi:hypothetical protein